MHQHCLHMQAGNLVTHSLSSYLVCCRAAEGMHVSEEAVSVPWILTAE